MSVQSTNHNLARDSMVRGVSSSNFPENNVNRLISSLKDIDSRIQTWKRIAKRESIDISGEKEHLKWLSVDVRISSGKHAEEVSLLRQQKVKRFLCSKIIRKVRENLKCELSESKQDELKQELAKVTQEKLLRWREIAEIENVDISEEMNVLVEALKNGLYTLQQTHSNENGFSEQIKAREVVFRQQIDLRSQCCLRLISKVFASRIEYFAEKGKSVDWFDDERSSVIEGIKQEALKMLPIGGKDLSMVERRCTELFEVYLINLGLFEDNPERYYALADREWVIRNTIVHAENLIRRAKGYVYLSSFFIDQIISVAQTAINILQHCDDSEINEVRQRANRALNVISERINNPNQIYSCGFGEE